VTVRDPAGLLGRIQELEPLCSDPGIRRAVESGDPFKVYRAIWWARRTGKLVAHRRTLDLLLRSRRAFAKPVKGKLFLGTFNSFGATLLGSAEEEPDGTRIATHHVVALFAVPLFPLGAYVVAGGERKGLSTAWNVFARVPLSPFTWLWSRGVALALVAAVASAGASALWASRHHDVTIVNGLAVPVKARIGGATRDVAPGQRVAVNVPVGSHRAVAATAEGAEIEAFDLPVAAGGKTLLVWNVGGAAPVYRSSVEYFAKEPPKTHQAPRPTLHCGDRFVTVPSVDYPFVEPPSSISMPKGSSVVTHRHVGIVSKTEGPQAAWCIDALFDEGRYADALHVMEARGAAERWQRGDAMFAVRLAAAVGPADAERVARAIRAALPDDLLIERVYQNTLQAAGKGTELLAEYRRRAEAAPGSPVAAYLHVRLLDGSAQRDAAEAALARFPAAPELLRLVTSLRVEAEEHAAALEAYRALRAVSLEQAGQVLDDAAVALVALGRRDEARAELAAMFDALPPGDRGDAAALFARVAALDRAAAPDLLVRRLEEKGPAPLVRARAGLPVPAPKQGEEPLVMPALYALAAKDPAAALAKLGELPPIAPLQLDAGTWALLFCEAARVRSPVEQRLVPFAHVRPEHVDVLRRYVRGEAVVLPRVPLEIRAAAAFVRSRGAALAADERARLVATARASDALAGCVTEAIARWPAAAR
jgi:hypothetical protein